MRIRPGLHFLSWMVAQAGSFETMSMETNAPGRFADYERAPNHALILEGLSNKQIGRRLTFTEGTVKPHLHNIFQKLGVANRTALAVRALAFT
jgi:two-component system, NarL family, nitrate/nitrite response regulator NarL